MRWREGGLEGDGLGKTEGGRCGGGREGGREGPNTPYLLILVRHLPPHLAALGHDFLGLCGCVCVEIEEEGGREGRGRMRERCVASITFPPMPSLLITLPP
jgi:hypothetical protein